MLDFAAWLDARTVMGRPADPFLVLKTVAAALVLVWNAEAADRRNEKHGPGADALRKELGRRKPSTRKVRDLVLAPRVQGRITRTDLKTIWPVLHEEEQSADWFRPRIAKTPGILLH